MQNEETDLPLSEKHSGRGRQAKSCCLLSMTAMLILFSLAIAAAACIIFVDSIMLGGEDYTLSRRVERYKAACQFIWYDFKEAVSRWKTKSTSSPVEPEIIQSPAEPPEVKPESKPEP